MYTLPPLNTYFLKLRAVDEVGNYSAFGAAPTSLPNMWTEVVLTNPSTEDGGTAGHNFGQWVTAEASINNDAINDIAVGSPNRGPVGSTNRGSVFIFYGAANFSTNLSAQDAGTCIAPACQELQPPTDPNVAGLFGIDVSMGGNVGDVASEAKADLLVGQSTWGGNVGRAFLYFGANAAQINAASFIEFRGTGTMNLGNAAKIINDIDGDGLAEVLLTAHTETVAGRANQGRIYIFKGRSADAAFMAGTPGANWFNSRTSTDGNGIQFIPTSAATWILEGPNPVVASNNEFGRIRSGLVSLGNLHSGSPVRNSFLIPMSRESLNRVAAYFGPQLPATGTLPFETPNLLQDIRSPTGSTMGTVTTGFGKSAVGGLNLSGGSGLDLLVGYPQQARIYLYLDLTGTGVAGCTSGTSCNPSLTIVGQAGAQFGFHVSAADLNADNAPDLVVGDAPTSPAARAWVLWQRMGSFDTVVDSVARSFWVSEFSVLSSSQQGRVNSAADIDGANGADLILADQTNGRVRIWR